MGTWPCFCKIHFRFWFFLISRQTHQREPETITETRIARLLKLQESEMLLNLILPLCLAAMLFVGLIELTSHTNNKDKE